MFNVKSKSTLTIGAANTHRPSSLGTRDVSYSVQTKPEILIPQDFHFLGSSSAKLLIIMLMWKIKQTKNKAEFTWIQELLDAFSRMYILATQW